MKKIFYKLLGLIIVLALVFIIFIDSIGKYYVQKYTQKLLKTPVKISLFSSHIFDKSLNIDFIDVQNFPNFNYPNLFSLAHFSLKIGEVNKNLIVIDEISLNKMTFFLDKKEGKVNLLQLFSNLENKDKKNTLTSVKTHKNQEKRIKIKHFKVNNISLKIDIEGLKIMLKVPDILISNFGGDSGVEISKIGKKIVKNILQHLEKSLEKEGVKFYQKEIKSNLSKKVKQLLGIDKGLDLDTKKHIDKIKNKAKFLFKDLGL